MAEFEIRPRRIVVDPTSAFCPNLDCPARGQAGKGNVGVHSRKERRFLCRQCGKSFADGQRDSFLSAAHAG